MTKTFLNAEKPLLTVMIQTPKPEYAIETAKSALSKGAEAFGLQACKLEFEYRNKETYRRIFDAMEDRPVYVTNYRTGRNNNEKSDDELGEGLILLAESGATLIDVMGDYYDKNDKELTFDPKAVDKQLRLIDRIHALGGEVLMSTHICKSFHSADEILSIAHEHEKRGADIAKIVSYAENEEQQIENLRITALLKKELKIPFLFLSGGVCDIHRRVGGRLGSCMYLCVDHHDELSTKSQPLLTDLKLLRDTLNL